MEGKIIEKKVNRKRPITYSFRVSEQERKIIDEKIKSSGLNRTEFLIRALRNKPVTVIGQGGELLTELKRQGNNLNQALRNSYLKPGEKQESGNDYQRAGNIIQNSGRNPKNRKRNGTVTGEYPFRERGSQIPAVADTCIACRADDRTCNFIALNTTE